jgi:hypothetical protein
VAHATGIDVGALATDTREMSKTSKVCGSIPRVFVVASGAAVLVLAAASAHADQRARYRFTTVLDSQRDGLDATRCAAINSFGVIAVQVRDSALGINKLITKSGAHDAPTVIVDTSSVADFPTFCDNGLTLIPSDPSINERGEVAFQGNLRRLTTREDCSTPEQRARRQGVFLGKGGPLTAIAHSVNAPGGNVISEFLVADQSVNSFGNVALVPELDVTFDQGVFVGSTSGTLEQRYLADVPVGGFTFSGTSSRVSLNELGQIAFRDNLEGTNIHGIFLSNPDGTFATIVDNTAGISASDPSLNVFGRVAFQSERVDAAGQQIFAIQTSRGGRVTTVAESNPDPAAIGPVYQSFREPSLNDLGEVVFTADVQLDPSVFITTQGVFTGPDPVADKVLQVGDRFEGVPVTSIVTCSEALNNRGEIAMTVQSENPDTFEVRTFIVKATPKR